MTVALNGDNTRDVVGFSTSDAVQLWPEFVDTLLEDIRFYVVEDSTMEAQMDDFARIVHNLTALQNPINPYDSFNSQSHFRSISLHFTQHMSALQPMSLAQEQQPFTSLSRGLKIDYLLSTNLLWVWSLPLGSPFWVLFG